VSQVAPCTWHRAGNTWLVADELVQIGKR